MARDPWGDAVYSPYADVKFPFDYRWFTLRNGTKGVRLTWKIYDLIYGPGPCSRIRCATQQFWGAGIYAGSRRYLLEGWVADDNRAYFNLSQAGASSYIFRGKRMAYSPQKDIASVWIDYRTFRCPYWIWGGGGARLRDIRYGVPTNYSHDQGIERTPKRRTACGTGR